MNKSIVIIVVLVSIVLFSIAMMSGEYAMSVIEPSYTPFIPSQEGPSRGGELMFKLGDLSVPGWKWDDCCS